MPPVPCRTRFAQYHGRLFRRWRSDFAACGFRKKPSACSRCSRSFLPDSISFRTTSTGGSTSTTPRSQFERARCATSNASTRRSRASRSADRGIQQFAELGLEARVACAVSGTTATQSVLTSIRCGLCRTAAASRWTCSRSGPPSAEPGPTSSGTAETARTADGRVLLEALQSARGILGGAWPSTNRPDQLIFDAITGDTRHIMLAGHFPHLPRLLGRLKTGNAAAPPVEFPLNGVVALENVEGSGGTLAPETLSDWCLRLGKKVGRPLFFIV